MAKKNDEDKVRYSDKELAEFKQIILDKIEETRLDETAKIATITSIEAEKTVLGKSDLETKIYILIGSAVLITTIILLTQDKK